MEWAGAAVGCHHGRMCGSWGWAGEPYGQERGLRLALMLFPLKKRGDLGVPLAPEAAPGQGQGEAVCFLDANSQKCSHGCPVARPGPLAWLSPVPSPGWPHPHNTDMSPQLLGEIPKACGPDCVGTEDPAHAAPHQHIWLLPRVNQVYK